MANESQKKDIKAWYIVLIVLMIVSIGVNVYLFRYHAKQDDAVEVMVDLLKGQPWETIDAQLQVEIASIMAMLSQMAEEQALQEAVTQDILAALENEPWAAGQEDIEVELSSISIALSQFEGRQIAQERAIMDIMDLLASEPWSGANEQVHERFTSIDGILGLLIALQREQNVVTTEIKELLASKPWDAGQEQIEEGLREVNQALGELKEQQIVQNVATEEVAIFLKSEPWDTEQGQIQASIVQIQEELAIIKGILDELVIENKEETDPEESIPAMASAQSTVTYGQEVEAQQTNGVVAVKLLSGDNVWNIVSRFYDSPSPGLVKKVVDFNDILDARFLPVGFNLRVPLEMSIECN